MYSQAEEKNYENTKVVTWNVEVRVINTVEPQAISVTVECPFCEEVAHRVQTQSWGLLSKVTAVLVGSAMQGLAEHILTDHS